MKVNYSKKLSELKSIILKRLKTKNLKTASMRLALASMPFIATIVVASKAAVNNSFEYDNNSNQSLSEAYEEYSGVELDDKVQRILDTLASYEEAGDTYEQISSLADVDPSVSRDAIKDVVTTTKDSLLPANEELIRERIIEEYGLSSNAQIDIKSSFNSADGISHVIIVTDGDNKFTIDRIPSSIRPALDARYEIGRYQGDGTSAAWASEIDDYKDQGDRIYYSTLDLADNDKPVFKR